MAHLSQSQDHPWNSKDTEMMMETLKRSQRHKAVGKIQGLHQQSLHAVAPSLPVPSRSAGDLPFPFLLARAVEGKWECLGK